ncbi:alpha/beta-hydrolase [Athelia psychrophila]|uniref:Carboxypeptidase n=1 Tax=Athelia psychrophila TaxID=1759441 RepID=A0A166CFU8_9AGAM|nr:alpha/beta-hydrolase [Fibularhizoctonia sp. CBS 109695]
MASALLTTALLGALSSAVAQTPPSSTPPSSWPQNYTGIPAGGYSTAWQNYFEVTDPLPNVTAPLARSFAGSILTNRPDHRNTSLFFWGFEKTNGSLTAVNASDDEPWLIWLNGGPGASSFLGFFLENGPLEIQDDYTIKQNNYSWSKQADTFWVDQPAGTGFSTTDADGYVADQEQVGEDFVGFLTNLVAVFPGLATRPFYLTGESYAGRFIPYISKALFSLESPPVNLKKLVIGDGAIGSFAGYEEIPTVHTLEAWPQIIDFDVEVLEYWKEQTHLCGYDLNLTYPQAAPFPSLTDPRPTVSDPSSPYYTPPANLSASTNSSSTPSSNGSFAQARSLAAFQSDAQARRAAQAQVLKRAMQLPRGHLPRDVIARRDTRKRDLAGRANGTLDAWYGCFLWEEMYDYATNFTFPWTNGAFDPYNIPDGLNPEVAADPSVFLNDNRTRAALHAPTSLDWAESINYPWNSTYIAGPGSDEFGDPSVEATAFFSELATNASAHGASIILFSGNDDSLVAPRSNEVVIQNTTFGGIQGFTQKPSTPWYNDDGVLAGVVHQERNLTYALFLGAGHEVPEYQPANAYVFLREFILGTNTTGLLLPNATTPIGGQDAALAGDIVPGGSVIYYGSGTTASSTVAPSASFAAWASYLATATLTANGTANATSTGSGSYTPSATGSFTPSATGSATTVVISSASAPTSSFSA